MTGHYYSDSYCCPHCVTALTLIHEEITGIPVTCDALAHCPSCGRHRTVRITDSQLGTLIRFVRSKIEVRTLVQTRIDEQNRPSDP